MRRILFWFLFLFSGSALSSIPDGYVGLFGSIPGQTISFTPVSAIGESIDTILRSVYSGWGYPTYTVSEPQIYKQTFGSDTARIVLEVCLRNHSCLSKYGYNIFVSIDYSEYCPSSKFDKSKPSFHQCVDAVLTCDPARGETFDSTKPVGRQCRLPCVLGETFTVMAPYADTMPPKYGECPVTAIRHSPCVDVLDGSGLQCTYELTFTGEGTYSAFGNGVGGFDTGARGPALSTSSYADAAAGTVSSIRTYSQGPESVVTETIVKYDSGDLAGQPKYADIRTTNPITGVYSQKTITDTGKVIMTYGNTSTGTSAVMDTAANSVAVRTVDPSTGIATIRTTDSVGQTVVTSGPAPTTLLPSSLGIGSGTGGSTDPVTGSPTTGDVPTGDVPTGGVPSGGVPSGGVPSGGVPTGGGGGGGGGGVSCGAAGQAPCSVSITDSVSGKGIFDQLKSFFDTGNMGGRDAELLKSGSGDGKDTTIGWSVSIPSGTCANPVFNLPIINLSREIEICEYLPIVSVFFDLLWSGMFGFAVMNLVSSATASRSA